MLKLFQNSYETKICVLPTVSAKCEPRLVRDGSAGGWGPAAAAMQIPANYCNTGPLPGHCISRSRRADLILGGLMNFIIIISQKTIHVKSYFIHAGH